jgi:hypothetical protein
MEEIWTQNSMTDGTDKVTTVRALVYEESAVAFETALQDARVTVEDETVPISIDHVQEVPKAVTETVFPHHALETEQLWMNRKMFKQVEWTARKMTASINCLNNALPFFPNVTEASKLLEVELIGLLKWSLPVTCRARFDLNGYISTLHSKTKLIEACREIGQSKTSLEKQSKEESSHNHKMVKRAATKSGAPPDKEQKSVSNPLFTSLQTAGQ